MSINFERYYGMLREQISIHFLPEHPIPAIWNNGIPNGLHISKKVYWLKTTFQVIAELLDIKYSARVGG